MFEQLDDRQAHAVLGAMKSVAGSGSGSLRTMDRRTLDATGPIGLVRGSMDVASLGECSPPELAALLPSPEDRRVAVRVLTVMSLVNGVLEPQKVGHVLDFAAEMGVDEEYLGTLGDATSGRLGRATDLLAQRAAEAYLPEKPMGRQTDGADRLMPFGGGNSRPRTSARYERLEELPRGTFGRAFYEHFSANNISLPGADHGQIEMFAMRHDTAHLLSDYSITESGELLTAAFIAGMHDENPMESQILPGLFIWHLGIKLNWLVGSHRGAFDPEKFWTAWARGAATRIDVFSPEWEFWPVMTQPLEEVRELVGVPELDPSMHS